MFRSSFVLSRYAVATELLQRGHQRPALRLGGAPVRLGLDALSHAVVGRIALWRRRAIDRAELMRMSRLELSDIRLNPGDARDEASKPFWRG